jgi:hypothetical protein
LLKPLVSDHLVLVSDERHLRIITYEQFTPEALAAAVVRAQF